MTIPIEQRIADLERSNRRQRRTLLLILAALAGAAMLGLQPQGNTTIDGFSAVSSDRGGMSYFRLVNKDTVEILDTSRGDRWFWRRIRNWPE